MQMSPQILEWAGFVSTMELTLYELILHKSLFGGDLSNGQAGKQAHICKPLHTNIRDAILLFYV